MIHIMVPMITKIISGGQTGVDRAAFDIALELGIPCSGWCPKGRRAEDGPLDARYPLTGTAWEGYPQRTQWNVRDSDGTLILVCAPPDKGTALTERLAELYQKPLLVIDLKVSHAATKIRDWSTSENVSVLNVAGPRESSNPGGYGAAKSILREFFISNSR
jgi:hypothetical protein